MKANISVLFKRLHNSGNIYTIRNNQQFAITNKLFGSIQKKSFFASLTDNESFPKRAREKLVDPNFNPPLSEAKFDNPRFAVERKLEEPKSKKKQFLVFLVVAGLTWGIGMNYAFNYSKMSSSSVTAALFIARHSDEVREILGANLDCPSLFTKINGQVNNVKGMIDVDFNVIGSNNELATLRLKCHRSNNELNTWATDEFYIETKEGKRIYLQM
ncbi:hypothetical protein BB559_002991 [Furculomyces boomerangus]|uniref:Uncharacterized protein n=1 Tax=Furculomyces boomerangus TaxID=61424 RepID=A0A2T9YQ89_9FUNG|nr:hypothetical protein BB559_002991 [Furculomyces boomerangus]